VTDAVRVTVGAELLLHDLQPRSIERLRFALSYPHPDRAKAVRMRRDPAGIPLRYECITEWPDGTVAAPRGAVDVVRGALAEDDLRPEFTDRRELGAALGPAALPPHIRLRPYQADGIKRLLSKVQGMIVLPPGAGKTVLGAGAIVAAGRTTIVLVHTEDLLDQWVEEVRALGIEPGVVDGDHKRFDAPVVVASVFTLVEMLEEHPSLGARFGLVILDEAHHAPNATTQRCLRHLPAHYRLGLTATPDREDGHGKLVDWSFGPRLLVQTVKELVAGGYLLMPTLDVVESGFTFDGDPKEDRRYLTKLHRALVADPARNDLIVDRALWEVQAGETVLLLSNRKDHCRRLGKMLAKLGVDARVVVGTTAKGARKANLRDLKSGDAPIVIATSLADEGLDVRRLSRIILAFPETARGRTIQRVGRLTRLFEGKEPKVIDVVDRAVDTLANRFAARRRSYRSIGMEA
jgi:superfamily II DNA or RNA helicase